MLTINPQYITDDKGKKLSVVISMEEFEALMEDLDDLEDIRLYDDAMLNKEPSIPIDEAFRMVEASRKCL